jgi:hypothetical protein
MLVTVRTILVPYNRLLGVLRRCTGKEIPHPPGHLSKGDTPSPSKLLNVFAER